MDEGNHSMSASIHHYPVYRTIADPIKGIIVATLTKVFSPALEINLIPKALLISAKVLPGMDSELPQLTEYG